MLALSDSQLAAIMATAANLPVKQRSFCGSSPPKLSASHAGQEALDQIHLLPQPA